MASTIVLFDDFDADKVLYKDPKRSGRGPSGPGALSVYMSYGVDGTPIRIQTPRMRAPFGISSFDPKPGTNDIRKYTLDLSFDRHTTEGSDNALFYEMWTGLDDRNKKQSHSKCVEWFGKKMSDELIGELYTSAIKPSKKEEYPPTLKCNVPFRDGQFQCRFFDENRQPATFADVQKGCDVQVILEVSRMWFMDKQFGCTPVVQSLQFFPSNRMPDEYCFVDRGVANRSPSEGAEAEGSDDETVRENKRLKGLSDEELYAEGYTRDKKGNVYAYDNS